PLRARRVRTGGRSTGTPASDLHYVRRTPRPFIHSVSSSAVAYRTHPCTSWREPVERGGSELNRGPGHDASGGKRRFQVRDGPWKQPILAPTSGIRAIRRSRAAIGLDCPMNSYR